MYSFTASMLYLGYAEIGTMSDDSDSATPPRCLCERFHVQCVVHELEMRNKRAPFTNAEMLFWCSNACASLIRSTLFYRMIRCSSFMISTAAKCSDVCGCGHVSFAAMRRSAACSVHHSRAVQHRSHEDIVSWTIDERDVAYELHPVSASRSLARWVVLLVGAV